LTKLRAKRAQEARDAELQKDVETKRAEMELERLRATDVTKAQIAKESSSQNADAAHYMAVRNADAKMYTQQKATEAAAFESLKVADNKHYAMVKAAEASFIEASKQAEVEFYQLTKQAEASALSKKLEAEAVMEMAKSYKELANAFGGPEGLLRYLMIERGVYTDLAKHNAEAIRGLNPKINIWNTGGGDSSSSSNPADAMATIRSIAQGLPPLLAVVQDQTGITPPPWMIQMPPAEGAGRSADS